MTENLDATATLDAEAMMRAAERATGLGDWGPDRFLAPFKLLISDLNRHARLTEIGRRRTYRRLFDNLRARLMLVEDRKRFPGIAREVIAAPIVVSGLPRAGTTFFHNLLAADPVNRSPATWEIMYPSPPPGEAGHAEDPRIERAVDAMRYEGFLEAGLQAIHPFDARRPEECNFMWELSFMTVNYAAWWHVPNYARLLYEVDFRWVYEEQKQVLQQLQHRFRRARWVLKTPAHMAWMEDLFAVFPDARFVQCHRDPAKIIPSLANNLAVWRRTFSDLVPPGDFNMLERQASGLARLAAFRARPGQAGRFFDAHYLDVQADPIGALRQAYDTFGIALAADRESAIDAWMTQDRAAHARGPKHSYELKDFGLDYAEIDRVMGPYMNACRVRRERAA